MNIPWTVVDEVGFYKLYRNISDISCDSKIYEGNDNDFQDTGLSPATKYYKLEACNNIGCSDKSESCSATIGVASTNNENRTSSYLEK